MWTRRAAAIVALPAIVVAMDARADDAPRARRTVQVTVVAGGDEAAALVDSIRELLARLQLATVEGEPASDDLLARVRVDLASSDHAAIVVTNAQTGEVVEQRSVPRDASRAIVREEIAHAVQSAIDSQLLSAQDRARLKPAAPPPAPAASATPNATPTATSTPTPPSNTTPPSTSDSASAPTKEQPLAARPSSSSYALDLATLFGAGPFGSGSGAVVRFGGGAVVASRRGLRPSLAATATFALPFDASSPYVESHAGVTSARAVASIELWRASWIALDLGAGGGVDWIASEPRSAVLPPSALGDATTRADPIVTGALAAHVAIASGVVLTVDALVDGDLATRRYVIDQAGTQSDVFAPWRLRPMILAGFTFTALGEGLFAREGAR